MITLGSWRGARVSISTKPNCLTVSIETPAGTDVTSWDHAGRLWTAFLGDVSYRRGLDGKMLAKWRTPGNARQRRWLARADALAVEARARQMVLDLMAGDLTLYSPLPPLAQLAFERAAQFDAARSSADAARCAEIYKPVGILPPDQYMAVVLQMTEGCSFNTCTFCDFYKGRPFRIKPPDEFLAHAQAVKAFLGDGLSLRRTIFLGDANALVIPMPRLLPLLDAVHAVYDVDALGGLYAFLDGFSGEKKTADDYLLLAARGVTRVYIGMESGSADLLAFLCKPGKPSDVLQAVIALKQAGIAVGLILLLGAGGERYAAQHVAETITLINAMPLDGEDIIYLSELVADDAMAYARLAADAHIQPLSHTAMLAQGEAMEAGFVFRRSMPIISRYDIREFIY